MKFGKKNTAAENNVKNIPFVEISLDHDQDARKMLKGMNCKTVPQIFAEEQHIGGYTDLRNFLIK